MSTAVERRETRAPSSTETMADLLRRLGDISPQRVRMQPPPGTATVNDVVAIDDHEDRLFELIDGVLVEKGMGYYESWLASFIASALNAWILPRKLGAVTGEAGMLRLFRREVRIPDVAYTSWQRLGGQFPKEPVPLLVPELVVEVLSESNTKREMERKRGEYFQAGVRLLWQVDPETRTVAVYTGPEQVNTLTQDQSLDGADVLPGFVLSLAELFASAPK